MTKKVIKEDVGDTQEVVRISEITADFGRADLNELASKLNEVIRQVNK